MRTALRGRLILLCGIAGSGKTSIALAIGAGLERCVHIETDVVRGMVAKPPYASGESRFVYRAAISVAEQALKHRFDVVLVATFAKEEFRREAINKLGDLCEVWLVVWAWCDPLLAFQRNSQRNPRVSRESFMRLWGTFEPPRDALVIDSRATSPEEAAKKILATIGEDVG
ncbi:MAG: AAA family ATPase [Thaumarchaeota archaeon]|nr:AAA family ATPase [Nitrososphaerota archaeon]